MLFDTFDATDLNKELKSLMDGLSVKVGGGVHFLTNLRKQLDCKQVQCVCGGGGVWAGKRRWESKGVVLVGRG